ncbi:MAG: response regulator transcription factor [Microthrixaceae bacterium]|nr:response regulator transcription factor [Microthrixaceae bacterium]
MTRTILIVEDEASIAAAVSARLRSEGFVVHIAADGPSAVSMHGSLDPDLVVLDLMLPGFGGLEVCRRIQRDRHVPVIMLTALDDEADKLVGLNLGADDYLTKPFSPRELVARVHAILRRVDAGGGQAGQVITNGGLRIDGPTRTVRWRDDEVRLTATEFDLLACLAGREGAVLSREQLLSEVWGHRDGFGTRTVDSHVRSIRRKLDDEVVRTVHGVGYALGSTS